MFIRTNDKDTVLINYSKTYVVHLNAADFGPIQVDSGLMPVRPTCVAGAKALAAGLWRVRSWPESGRVTSVLGVCLVLKLT